VLPPPQPTRSQRTLQGSGSVDRETGGGEQKGRKLETRWHESHIPPCSSSLTPPNYCQEAPFHRVNNRVCTSHTVLFSPPDFQTPFKYIQNQKGLIFAMHSNGPLTPSLYGLLHQLLALLHKWLAQYNLFFSRTPGTM
jgi:hypothetical protein